MIYTWGYLGYSFASLQAWLVANDGWLVDIRYSPNSRQPGWSGRALARALGGAYTHIEELGNRNYRAIGRGHIDIVDMDKGLRWIDGLAQGRTPVLLCACRLEVFCHRTVVAEELRRRGHRVEELVLKEGVTG